MKSINEQMLKLKYFRNNENKPSVKIHSQLNDCIEVSPIDNSLLDLSPKSEEVIIDIATGQSALRGSHIFAPGIMAMTPEIKIGSTISVYTDLAQRCKKGYQKYYDNPLKIFVGNGVAKMNRRQLFSGDMNPKGIAIEMTDPITGVPSFTLPNEYGMLQNLPSIVTGYALNVNENNLKVLDMCAAPGNKTTHLAILMNNKGSIDALDKSKSKLKKLKLRCDDFGIENVRIHHFDSLISVDSNNKNIGSEIKPPFKVESFDRVLLDAPCSNLGQRPLLKIEAFEKLIKSFPALQKKLLINAIDLLKPGGILVYSTCTITIEENEQNVAWVLEKYPQMELMAINSQVGSSGITQVGLSENNCELVRRFGPENAKEDSIGFFIAKFHKKY
ncbi:putative methyltransferase NSUN6 isoform X2 [Sipha flava]|nr:putative methyltransferase NSUN6 isoform X2 [Sipha flava]